MGQNTGSHFKALAEEEPDSERLELKREPELRLNNNEEAPSTLEWVERREPRMPEHVRVPAERPMVQQRERVLEGANPQSWAIHSQDTSKPVVEPLMERDVNIVDHNVEPTQQASN